MDWLRHALLLSKSSEEKRFNYYSKYVSKVFPRIPLSNLEWKYELPILEILQHGNYDREETLELFLK